MFSVEEMRGVYVLLYNVYIFHVVDWIVRSLGLELRKVASEEHTFPPTTSGVFHNVQALSSIAET